MTPREAEQLLGGYAAGILSPDEHRALMAAAIENQALFDALADEEELRALMADPAARAELLRAVAPVATTRSHWWTWVLGGVPVAGLAALLVMMIGFQGREKASRTEVAVAKPASGPVAEPMAAPVVPPTSAKERDSSRDARRAPAADPPPAAPPVPAQPRREALGGTATAQDPAPPASQDQIQARARAPEPQQQQQQQHQSPVSVAVPAAVVTEPVPLRQEEGKAKQDSTAPPQSKVELAPGARAANQVAPAPAFQHRFERRNEDGTFATVTGTVPAGDFVRLVVTPVRDGWLSATSTTVSRPARPVKAGQQYYVPEVGPLPAASRRLTIRLTLASTPPDPMAIGGAILSLKDELRRSASRGTAREETAEVTIEFR